MDDTIKETIKSQLEAVRQSIEDKRRDLDNLLKVNDQLKNCLYGAINEKQNTLHVNLGDPVSVSFDVNTRLDLNQIVACPFDVIAGPFVCTVGEKVVIGLKLKAKNRLIDQMIGFPYWKLENSSLSESEHCLASFAVEDGKKCGALLSRSFIGPEETMYFMVSCKQPPGKCQISLCVETRSAEADQLKKLEPLSPDIFGPPFSSAIYAPWSGTAATIDFDPTVVKDSTFYEMSQKVDEQQWLLLALHVSCQKMVLCVEPQGAVATAEELFCKASKLPCGLYECNLSTFQSVRIQMAIENPLHLVVYASCYEKVQQYYELLSEKFQVTIRQCPTFEMQSDALKEKLCKVLQACNAPVVGNETERQLYERNLTEVRAMYCLNHLRYFD